MNSATSNQPAMNGLIATTNGLISRNSRMVILYHRGVLPKKLRANALVILATINFSAKNKHVNK